MRAFSYHAPSTLSDAFAFLDARTRPLAGGTDLLTLMKADLVAPERLVNVKALLPRGIAAGTDGLTIGALTTLEEMGGFRLKVYHTLGFPWAEVFKLLLYRDFKVDVRRQKADIFIEARA